MTQWRTRALGCWWSSTVPALGAVEISGQALALILTPGALAAIIAGAIWWRRHRRP